jgi:peptide chain release factor 1
VEIAPSLLAKLRVRAARYHALTEEVSRPEVASDVKRFPALLRERGALESMARLAERFDALAKRRAEAAAMLADPALDAELRELAEAEQQEVEQEQRELDARLREELVSDPDDQRRKLIMEIRAGTGGDEAGLFARDLFEIYKRFCEAKHFKLEVLELSTNDLGGFKEVIFAVEGDGAWSLLRYESGGHRVQRVPATEAQGRIHTSAATVAVLPEAEDVELELKDGDLRIDTMRAGGAGGQHVNKTESAVRITHLPTGMVVTCMDERSQHKNRARALRILRSRLLEAEQARRHAERAAWRRSQVGSGDRNERVRTYNWPQNRVTDHRLNANFSLEHVLSGKLGPMLEGLLAMDREERVRNL